MLGGIIVNVVLAIIIYAMVLFTYGEKKLPISEVSGGVFIADSIGYQLGFRNGDKFISINGSELKYFTDITPELLYARTVVVEREGQVQTLDMPVNLVEKFLDKK